MVELTGFEPVASSMPWKRATNCAIAPASLRTDPYFTQTRGHREIGDSTQKDERDRAGVSLRPMIAIPGCV